MKRVWHDETAVLFSSPTKRPRLTLHLEEEEEENWKPARLLIDLTEEEEEPAPLPATIPRWNPAYTQKSTKEWVAELSFAWQLTTTKRARTQDWELMVFFGTNTFFDRLLSYWTLDTLDRFAWTSHAMRQYMYGHLRDIIKRYPVVLEDLLQRTPVRISPYRTTVRIRQGENKGLLSFYIAHDELYIFDRVQKMQEYGKVTLYTVRAIWPTLMVITDFHLDLSYLRWFPALDPVFREYLHVQNLTQTAICAKQPAPITYFY